MADKADDRVEERSFRLQAHQLVMSRWQHSEQIRWTLFNNFLLAHSIMLLAWAAIFATGINFQQFSKTRVAVLLLVSFAGGWLSAIWWAIAHRADIYHREHFIAAACASEVFLPPEYHVMRQAESIKKEMGTLFLTVGQGRLKSWVKKNLEAKSSSGWVQRAVPKAFFGLHAVLFASMLVQASRALIFP